MIITYFLKYWKYLLLLVLIGVGVWMYKDYQFQKAENKRQTENAQQLRRKDSVGFAEQLLSKQEINDYLEYDNKDLKLLLEQNNIRENRLQSILSNQYRYQDKTEKGYDVSGLIAAINQKREFTVPFSDTTKCMQINGNVTFKNDSLKVNITDRQFKNKTDNVVYWQHREWKFLGIKTRFLGKKEFTAKTFDQCGKSEIMKIEKKQ